MCNHRDPHEGAFIESFSQFFYCKLNSKGLNYAIKTFCYEFYFASRELKSFELWKQKFSCGIESANEMSYDYTAFKSTV